MPTLILDAHCPAALEAVQSLGRAGAIIDIASEKADYLARRSRYVRRPYQQPPGPHADAFLQWLQQLDSANRYRLLIPATETSLAAINEVPDSHGLRKKAMLASKESIDIALDKQRTWELARSLGIDAPDARLLTKHGPLEPPSRFPIVLKPVRSQIVRGYDRESPGVCVARDQETYDEYLTRFLQHTPIQQQDYFLGTAVGIEMLYDWGCEVWCFAHERIHEMPLTGGGSTLRRSIRPPPQLLEAARAMLGALRWHGVAMIEFKRGEAGSYALL